MTKLHNAFKTTRLSIWLLLCILILAATSVYAAGNERPLSAVDILGSPDAAVNGKFAVGTTTPGGKALTVAGVIDFVGAGTVHNYFTQGPGNNMQIRSNVDEYNAVGSSSYAQWNMVMGASLDVFSIRRSPASATYNEDALFWIEGSTGNIGISKVDTSNGASIPFTLNARLHVETDSGNAIWGISTDSTGVTTGIYGVSESTQGYGVFGYVSASIGSVYGVVGGNESTAGAGLWGYANATAGSANGVNGVTYSNYGTGVSGVAYSITGNNFGVYGRSFSTDGIGVTGVAQASTGYTFGVYGRSESPLGYGVYGYNNTTSGTNYGVYGISDSNSGRGVYGIAGSTSGTTYGVYGRTNSSSGARGVYGLATTGSSVGVMGYSEGTSGKGVYGIAAAASGTTQGVYGQVSSPDGYAVYAFSSSTSAYDFYAAGNGTDYGPFTGAHEVILSESFPQEPHMGLIVSATGEAQVRHSDDGSVDLSSTLPEVKLADTVEDKAVLGVLVAEVNLPDFHWYTAGDGERFGTINALGEGRVWVTDINGDIEAGDAITTSVIPGYGQLQDDDFIHIYTLGKATETVDWDSVTETVAFNGQEYKVYLLAVVYTSG
jgi:hypothetical protein